MAGSAPVLTYTPNHNYNGADSLTYRIGDGARFSNDGIVTLQIDPVNDRPLADDQSRAVAENGELLITLTGMDVEGGPLTFVVEGGPYNGSLSGAPPAVTYTPNALFNGIDFFTFHAHDGTDSSPTASVMISVYDSTAPADVTGFKAWGGDGEVRLTWSNPSDADLAGVRIRRGAGTCPTDVSSGTQVVDASFGLTAFVDEGLVNGTTYCYKAFAYDDAARFAAGVTASDVAHQALTLQDVKRYPTSTAVNQFGGTSVAINGDYAVSGASGDNAYAGAVYVYHRDPVTGAWDTGVKLVAPAPYYATTSRFGIAVAISGDYLVVGAYMEDYTLTDAGAAYVFHRIGTNTWDGGTRLIGNPASATAYFGLAVAISGDYVLVGAPMDDTGIANTGAAYIFRRTDTTTWDTGTKISATTPLADAYFGGAVDIDGLYGLVGARGETLPTGVTNAGAAYIFRRTGLNTWDDQARITAWDYGSSDFFGANVSISGDDVLIGAMNDDDGGTNAGAAYHFHRNALNTWDVFAKLLAPDALANDTFGRVAIEGNIAIIGAGNEDGAASNAGAAYIFQRDLISGLWDQGTRIQASDGQADDTFGMVVDLSGGVAVIGANGDDDQATSNGAIYLFR